jgi:predicted regulator of Ras-like GTPase activity (Roadblock/LC7/MglB family)
MLPIKIATVRAEKEPCQPKTGITSLTRRHVMSDIKGSLKQCLGMDGNPGFDLELAAAGNADVVRAKKSIRDKLGLRDTIEDILITLVSQYHLIRMVGTSMFLYVVLDRQKSNLALARKELASIDKNLEVERV